MQETRGNSRGWQERTCEADPSVGSKSGRTRTLPWLRQHHEALLLSPSYTGQPLAWQGHSEEMAWLADLISPSLTRWTA